MLALSERWRADGEGNGAAGTNWGKKKQCEWKGKGERMAGDGKRHAVTGAAGTSLSTNLLTGYPKLISREIINDY